MKKGIHPEYYPQAKVVCSCGNTWVTGSTKPVIHTDVCSACHPFFTGEQRIVDAEGNVERFMRRLERSQELKAARSEGAQEDKAEEERASSGNAE